jgi:hypothetical protein
MIRVLLLIITFLLGIAVAEFSELQQPPVDRVKRQQHPLSKAWQETIPVNSFITYLFCSGLMSSKYYFLRVFLHFGKSIRAVRTGCVIIDNKKTA